jgi:hypothetical protein
MQWKYLLIRAKLTLYTTESGGRTHGIKSGYRPNHVMQYPSDPKKPLNTLIGQVEFDKEIIPPGETEIVTITFIVNDEIVSLFTIGRIWWIHEGSRKVGEAEVLEIIGIKS